MKKQFIYLAGTLIVIVGLFFVLNAYIYSEKQSDMIPGETVTREGTVIAIDKEQAMVDGPILINLKGENDEYSTIGVPTMGLPLCAAKANITDAYNLKVGDKLEVRGIVSEDETIVPCESEDHYLRIVTMEKSVSTSQEKTVTGEYVCLPHKNTSGPQTMECALGIKTEAGIYYALDLGKLLYTEFDTKFPMGTKITVEGLLVPIEAISSDHWQKYPIEGILRAEKVTKA